MTQPCFSDCGCICGEQGFEFDHLVTSETKLDVRLIDIVSNHGGWYLDHKLEPGNPHLIPHMGGASGVYVLWEEAGACDVHEREHVRAKYVDKGDFARRLRDHWAHKEILGELGTQYSLFRCNNRMSKYLEQLFLDLFDFPMNTSEKSGTKRLCHHIGYADWN